MSEGTTATGLPPGASAYRRTAIFTETTIPPGLLGRHSTAPGVWGLIHVLEGRLLYRVLDRPSERLLDPAAPPGLVEPGVPHQIAPLGQVKFQVEFYRMPDPSPDSPPLAGGLPSGRPEAGPKEEGEGSKLKPRARPGLTGRSSAGHSPQQSSR